MFYEELTNEDFIQLIEDMTLPNGVTPQYEYEYYNIEAETYTNFTITKTAEEAYEEWLSYKDSVTDKMDTLEKENKQLWDTLELILKDLGRIPSEDNINTIAK